MRTAPSLATRTGRAFHASMIVAALAVGALQMYHVHGGLLTDYGADAFGTAWVYATMRLGRSIIQRGQSASAGRSAIVVFSVVHGLGVRTARAHRAGPLRPVRRHDVRRHARGVLGDRPPIALRLCLIRFVN